jgi:DNA repair protein RadC
MNSKNRIQHAQAIYQGTVNSAQIRPAEVFRPAMQLNSPAIIIAHAHPSGDPAPSPEDVLITRELVSAGNILEIELLDHLVVGAGKWVSMRERGLGFGK